MASKLIPTLIQSISDYVWKINKQIRFHRVCAISPNSLGGISAPCSQIRIVGLQFSAPRQKVHSVKSSSVFSYNEGLWKYFCCYLAINDKENKIKLVPEK
jgi:hypothetical protein